MSFLNKRKTPKTFKYYIGEVFIVIAGIFIAIQLNNWNQKNKENRDGINSLKRIKTDLSTEKFVLEGFKKRNRKSKDYLIDLAYNKKRENLDSIKYHFEAFIHYKLNSEYVNLKSSGKLNLIKNDRLRYYLVNFYELYYTVYEEIAEYHKESINGKAEDYFLSEFLSDTTFLLNPNTVSLKLKDKKFQNIIKKQISDITYIVDNIKIQRIDSLIKWIDIELKE